MMAEISRDSQMIDKRQLLPPFIVIYWQRDIVNNRTYDMSEALVNYTRISQGFDGAADRLRNCRYAGCQELIGMGDPVQGMSAIGTQIQN